MIHYKNGCRTFASHKDKLLTRFVLVVQSSVVSEIDYFVGFLRKKNGL